MRLRSSMTVIESSRRGYAGLTELYRDGGEHVPGRTARACAWSMTYSIIISLSPGH